MIRGALTLWGYHPRYVGADGYPYPLKLVTGNQREVNREHDLRTRMGGWTLRIYGAGVPPVGLRALCDAAYPNRSRLGES